MPDSKFLRAQAQRCLELAVRLSLEASPLALEAIADLRAMAAELVRRAEDIDGRPKRNGGDTARG